MAQRVGREVETTVGGGTELAKKASSVTKL